MNKYERTPDYIVDLHGHTTQEAKIILDEILESGKYKHLRIITGKGAFRETGPVLRSYVENYLTSHTIRFNYSKIKDGGEGALEAFIK